ncbi:ADP-ribosylglycohydrolase family protein [Erysipelothrix urinaevulpis]|uniref:ADP-ribosylglycohydrolase family protein n=1 Tax=Erysipelothrix urinaevulpis TaxID=2683717 RepID=UPI00135BF158|nr:ADP-ribosylglycohydrolase family protein [Erysipelothrix urinaevulpis]
MKHSINKNTHQRIYNGVLGKVIAVYLGKPVEGWSYDKIKNDYGYIDYFVHDDLEKAIIEPDDDISGTFSFIHAYNNDFKIGSKEIGDTWLNRVIEHKNIFWWGGLYRSTEHTAYYNLKTGIPAPKSGSKECNGVIVSEQIGSQIFIDGWGLLFPDDFKLAYDYACKAAAVSHDGIAIKMAGFIAALESYSFVEKDLDKAVLTVLNHINDVYLSNLVDEIIEVVNTSDHWRLTRNYIEDNHGYERYGGNCPIVTNFLVIIAALYHAPDSYIDAVAISISMGWDTDCNAGNVGCIQGIRCGLNETRTIALKQRVNEQLYVSDAMGEHVLSDACKVTNQIIALRNDDLKPRFSFNFPGSTQGFVMAGQGQISNNTGEGLNILSDSECRVSVELFKLKEDIPESGYEVMMLPQIYPGQSFVIKSTLDDKSNTRLGYVYWNANNDLCFYEERIASNNHILRVEPETGMIVKELYFILPKKNDCTIFSVDIKGSPSIEIKSTDQMSPNYIAGSNQPYWIQQFMDTTQYSTVDHLSSICISDERIHQLVYTGYLNMNAYNIRTKIELSGHQETGLVFHMRGLLDFYKLSINQEKNRIKIVKVNIHEEILITEVECELDRFVEIKGCIQDDKGMFIINDTLSINFEMEYNSGYVGYFISKGTLQVHSLSIGGIK